MITKIGTDGSSRPTRLDHQKHHALVAGQSRRLPDLDDPAAPPSLQSPPVRLLLIIIAFLPAIITGISIALNAVNIPVWDDWERGPLLERYYAGQLDFAFLNSAHIDHRMLVPRLLILASNELTGGNLVFEIWLSYGIYLAGGVALFLLLRKTFGETPWMWATALLVNLVLFSPVQYQNFLWAVQIAMLLPFACLGVILYTLRTELPIRGKFVICAVAALAGMHSFGHGILLWPAAIAASFGLLQMGSLRTRLWFSGGLTLVALITVSLYFFWDFTNTSIHAYGQMPGGVPPGMLSVAEGVPDRLGRFSLMLFGSSLSRLFPDAAAAAPSMGRLCLALFIGGCLACVALIWKRRNRAGWDGIWPWIVAGGYSIVAVVALSLGRAHGDLDNALHSRYTGAPMFLSISAVVLLSWLLFQWRNRASDPKASEFRSRAALCVTMVLIAVQFPLWMHGLNKMNHWKLARYQQRASLLYINHFEPKHFRRLDYDLEFARQYANLLNDQGLLDPPLFENRDFGSFAFETEPLEKKRSDLTSAAVTAEDAIDIIGFATIGGKDRIADGVLVAARPAGGSEDDWQVVELAEMEPLYIRTNDFVDEQFGSNRNLSFRRHYAKFGGSIPISSLPCGEIELAAWAMDTEKMRLHRVQRVLRFDTGKLAAGMSVFSEKG